MARTHKTTELDFRVLFDDLTDEATRALLALHMAGELANSPLGTVNALDLSALRAPGVSVWTIWKGTTLLAVGALKELGDESLYRRAGFENGAAFGYYEQSAFNHFCISI